MAEELEIVVDSTRANDCFGILADGFVESQIRPRLLNPTSSMFVLELRVETKPEVRCAVGCLSHQSAQLSGLLLSPATNGVVLKSSQLSLSPIFAADLGLTDGDLVTLRVQRSVAEATTVLVAPASIDDSEVVELNALQIESTLLRYLRVVFKGMKVTVRVHSGLQAKIVVQEIRCGGGGGATERSGGDGAFMAILCDGTELHVATRPRVQPVSVDSSKMLPKVGVLRMKCLNVSGISKPHDTSHLDLNDSILISKQTAEALQWSIASGVKTNTLRVALFALPHLAFLDGNHIEPSIIRSKACVVNVALYDNDDDAAEDLWMSAIVISEALCGMMRQLGSFTVIATPVVPDNVNQPFKDFFQEITKLPGACPASASIPLKDLQELHGQVPPALHKLLNFQAGQTYSRMVESHNVMLTGPAGSGKTATAVSSSLACGGHYVRYLACDDSKGFLPMVEKLMVACLLNAPSVLILDGIDKVAPSQKEGSVAAVSNATFAALEGTFDVQKLRSIPVAFGLSPPQSFTHSIWGSDEALSPRVICVGIASHRDNVFDSLRSARCFGTLFKLDPLNVDARYTFIRQELRDTPLGSLIDHISIKKALARRTENYTPYDLKGFTRRWLHRFLTVHRQDSASYSEKQKAVDTLHAVADTFQALAHDGNFYKASPSGQNGDAAPSWDDIGGLEEVKKVLHDTLILPSKMPKLFAKLPLKTRSGVLLFGPSGCGKTYALQVVVAAEKLNCIVVNGPEIFGKYIGQSEQKIREIFERAQAAAPSVIFFDEFDSVAPQRGNDNTGVTDRVVNQLLCYLDGVEARKDVFVVAASSRPDLIDAALLRPGRLDKAVYCPLPDTADRVQVIQAHLKKVNFSVTYDEIRLLSEQTEGWTSADLAALVATANLTVMQRTIDMAKELSRLNINGNVEAEGTTHGNATTFNFTVVKAPKKSQAQVEEQFEVSLNGVRSLDQVPNSKTSTTAAAVDDSQPKVTFKDLTEALAKSRRSMSDKDRARQEFLFRRFLQSREPGGGGGSPIVKPGSRVTMA